MFHGSGIDMNPQETRGNWQILSQPRRVSLERSRVHHWNPHPGSAMLDERTESKRKHRKHVTDPCNASERPVVKPSA